MPRGVPIADLQGRLFAAAETVMSRDGAKALTSRAVTEEAGCAKGLLHRDYGDFDGFLVALVHDRIRLAQEYAPRLREQAGTGTVEENVVVALTAMLGPTATAIVGLMIVRDELRARLRAERGPVGLPLLSDVAAALAGYLSAERALGRVPEETDVEALAPALIGTVHLLYADPSAPPERVEVRRAVRAVLP
ncbi:TetR family transcriptional regulator [Actinorhabdospora filicis]|uniref:TetR family transcriptional regulator n=1 Tax=Actinorhabdospora filicis TaxID=1785913 RepID=A0A9W6SNB7_9ACTN|nr:TetR family transcriptional regulator [Actinorhabdospora filicis]GLZ77726.1 TetR family transcriptional regulator [Actinorhabdospora filicis]